MLGIWGLLLALTACTSSSPGSRIAGAAPAATRVAPVAAATRPKVNSL